MLQTINDKAKGWVAYAIVIFISIPFMLFGIGSYLDGNEKVVAATVNGEDIEIAAVTTAALQQKERLTSIYGSLPPQLDDKTIKEQVLSDLINRELLNQSVDQYGYRASSQEVADMIRGIPSFQKDGQFDEATYQQLLQANRLTPALFEQQNRDELSLQQMTSSIADTSFVPKQQAELYQSLVNQERTGKVYSLRVESYRSKVTPDADKVKAFYDSNPALFESAERVKLRYLLVDRAQLAANLEVDDEKLAAYFDQNATAYRQPEQRKISHILVRTEAEGEVDEAAKQRAADIHARIVAGEKTFEELATTESDDTIAAEKAGDMGFMQLNQMTADQAAAAAALKVGEMSEPVLTEAGYEIIKLAEIKAEVIPSYEEVKDRVAADYRNLEAEKIFIDHVEKLQTLSFENEGSLEPAADALGAEVVTSDWMTRTGGEGIGQQASVREVAFSDEVMANRRNSSLIEISPTEAVVVRLDTHEDASVKPFAEVEAQATDAYIDSESRKLTRESGDALLAELQKTSDWTALEGVAELNPADIETFENLKRNDRNLTPQLVTEIFKLSPVESKVSFASTILPNGDYSLIGLDKVVDGDTAVSSGGLNSFKDELARREQDALIKAMREQAEVVVNDSALE